MKSKILDLDRKKSAEVELEIDSAISKAKKIHSVTFHGTFNTVPATKRYPPGTKVDVFGDADADVITLKEAFRVFSGTIIIIYDE